LRITGGILLGRNIEVPRGIIRPSMDKMRESVFACLGDLAGLSFLDIFTGSGIIALEAASRGASHIEAVEQDRQKRRTLLNNVSISPVRIKCHFIPAELYVKRAKPIDASLSADHFDASNEKDSFDIIFVDPPFPYRFKWELLSDIAASCLTTNGSRVLIHRPREDYQKGQINYLEKMDSRKYGRSIVDFFTVINKQSNSKG
jgi:16S rRNA (guanine(966)-N(2))-methyltransferase RsmD